jgi:hypothetical protein
MVLFWLDFQRAFSTKCALTKILLPYKKTKKNPPVNLPVDSYVFAAYFELL